jgi:hypothetical protein
MLYPIYTALKSHLNEADENKVIKGIEWYNVQYEGSIATTPRLFVEFPEPLNFGDLGKEADKRAPVKIRLHVVTQALAGADGAIDDQVAADHEKTALWVKNKLDNFLPPLTSSGAKPCLTLHFTAWQHFHKYKGWMVTFVEFTAKKTTAPS